jgi:1-acyl-sn-glycerol-3-phosphate acyltransferase
VKPFYRLSYLLAQAVSRVLFHLSVSGRENIPESGPFLAVSNHISLYDPPAVGSLLKREVSFLAKAELFDLFMVKTLVRKLNSLPVRRGEFDMSALKNSIAVLQDKGMPLLMFPEGTRIRTGDLGSPLRGVAFIAARTRVPVLPIYIENSDRLLDCLLFKRRLIVRMGGLVPYRDYRHLLEGQARYAEVADLFMSKIRELKDQT